MSVTLTRRAVFISRGNTITLVFCPRRLVVAGTREHDIDDEARSFPGSAVDESGKCQREHGVALALRLVGDPEQPRLAIPEILAAQPPEHFRAGSQCFRSRFI